LPIPGSSIPSAIRLASAREGEERPMKKYLIAVAVLIALAAPAGAQANNAGASAAGF
jgi:hypothetical protein